MAYIVREYTDVNGNSKVREWLQNLKDPVGKAKLLARVERARQGSLGDCGPVYDANGIAEMREHYGPGYRIYYRLFDRKMIILLVIATKDDQKSAIATAKRYLADYMERTKP